MKTGELGLKLAGLGNYPGVGATKVHVQVQRGKQTITVPGFNDRTRLKRAGPEPPVSPRMESGRKHLVSCQCVWGGL